MGLPVIFIFILNSYWVFHMFCSLPALPKFSSCCALSYACPSTENAFSHLSLLNFLIILQDLTQMSLPQLCLQFYWPLPSPSQSCITVGFPSGIYIVCSALTIGACKMKEQRVWETAGWIKLRRAVVSQLQPSLPCGSMGLIFPGLLIY